MKYSEERKEKSEVISQESEGSYKIPPNPPFVKGGNLFHPPFAKGTISPPPFVKGGRGDSEVLLPRLIPIIKPLIEAKGRKGDWNHICRAVRHGQNLLENEPGDPDIVFPALYLHDIGWTKINFQDFSTADPAQAIHTTSEYEHMKQGGIFAAEILRELHYPPDKIELIASIIAVHDLPDAIFALNNPSATLIFEADRLDRYGLESFSRFKDMFGNDYQNGQRGKDWMNYLKKGVSEWFTTPTGKAKAIELAAAGGLEV